MKPKAFLLNVPILIFFPIYLIAQPGSPVKKFGEVPLETFAPAAYSLDSSASAVILFDIGHVHFERGTSSLYGFNIVYERHTRIRLLRKISFGLSTIVLSRLKKGATGVEIEDLKGATYNMEEGKMIVSKVDKSNIFQEESGGFQLEKMILPSVKEGSVIEYSYRIVFPGFGYVPFWDFQGEYPILWSEYDITIPSVLDYVMEKQGYLKYTIDSTMAAYSDSWNGDATERIWAIQNVPGLARREAFITTQRNYISRIEFQLSAVHIQGMERTFRNTWDDLVTELMKSENFGAPLLDRNHWMSDELKKITGVEGNSLETAQKIYAYLRDHMECSGIEGIYLSQPLKKTWEDKKGNIADVNLLLAALYQHEGFEAVPILLSTRAHGTVVESYPLLKDYNYVVTGLKVGDRTYLLDATRSTIGFGQLPEACYNGSARTIDGNHQLIPLSPDSILERRMTYVTIINDDSLGYSGSFTHTAGIFESMELRSRLKMIKPEEFFDNLRKSLSSYKTMEETGIDSLDKPGVPVIWHYNMKYHFSSPTIYLNPIMHERINTNPFNSPERHYPVEMPYREDYEYVINLEVPKGYSVDQVPRSEKAILDSGNSGVYEYLVETDSAKIQLRCRLRIKKTQFGIGEYKSLRDFYAFVIRKEKEEIIFKKK